MARSSLAVAEPQPIGAIPNAEQTVRQDVAVFMRSLWTAGRSDEPYRRWAMAGLLDESVWSGLCGLPFAAPELDGVSGSREIHNQTRVYVDAANRAAHPVCERVAALFQHPATVAAIGRHTGARLDGCCLRLEYAQDTGDFWLNPHTDLGVKRFTLLIYLADAPGQEDLGTDVYASPTRWAGRAPFLANTAMAFVPSDDTWHGFEPRPIVGVRKSLIVNYVTEDWRAREQLAYPDQPVRS